MSHESNLQPPFSGVPQGRVDASSTVATPPCGRPLKGLLVAIIIAAGLAVRWPHLHQSLWLDEMTTLGEYVWHPWSKALAAGAGDYVPNNHVLHTILVKLIYPGGPGSSPNEIVLRTPACVTGLLVPLAVAWPLRRAHPWMALVLALVTELNPWLVADSVEARGYSLMLLLGILATNCLPTEKSRWPITYIFCTALAIYTVPLAGLLIPAHGIAMLVLRRRLFLRWMIAAISGLLLATALYLPMAAGMMKYYEHPFLASLDYRQFLDALPRFAFAGMRVPMHVDPFWNGHEPASAAIYWALPVIAIVIGSVVGWSRPAIRPLLVTMAAATVLAILLPLISDKTTEPRFAQWILPWFCISIVVVLMPTGTRWGRTVGTMGITALITWQVLMDIHLPTNQPIREGLALADEIVPTDHEIIALYVGGVESVVLYGDQIHHHKIRPALNREQLIARQRQAFRETGHLPWIIIFYERLAFDRDSEGNDELGLWPALMANYHLATARLPGRISPVAIYRPNRDP